MKMTPTRPLATSRRRTTSTSHGAVVGCARSAWLGLVLPLAWTIIGGGGYRFAHAGFNIEDVSKFSAILPPTCTGESSGGNGADATSSSSPSVVDELSSCFTINFLACTPCFDESLVVPAIPSALPATCDEAKATASVEGSSAAVPMPQGLMGVACALRECCKPCASIVEEAWLCVADGVEGIDAAECPLACDSGADVAQTETETETESESESESGSASASLAEALPIAEACVGLAEDWVLCFDALDGADQATTTTAAANTTTTTAAAAAAAAGGDEGPVCVACVESLVEGIFVSRSDWPAAPSDACDAMKQMTCGVSQCCSDLCSDETEALQSCIIDNGVHLSVDGGNDIVQSCNYSCSNDVTQTTVTMPAMSSTTTSTTSPTDLSGEESTLDSLPMGCVNGFGTFAACVANNVAECGGCATESNPLDSTPNTCADLGRVLCRLKNCCSQCSEVADAMIDTCRDSFNVDNDGGSGGDSNSGGENGDFANCEIVCESVDDTSSAQLTNMNVVAATTMTTAAVAVGLFAIAA